LLAAIGPALVLWFYGPYPDGFVMPLVLGGVGSLLGFVTGILVFQHPLVEEFFVILSKFNQQTANKHVN